MDCLIYFDKDICPNCGGKIELVNKNLHDPKQLYTDGYECESCHMKFGIEWISHELGVYYPHPLYAHSKIQNFKNYFLEEEEK